MATKYLDTAGLAYLAGKLDARFAKNKNVAAEFSEQTPYEIGDYCAHQGSFYKAINEHTGAWNAADFEEVTVAGELKEVADNLETVDETLENKANIDGSYETMTVGNAEQLVATVGVDDNSPYNFRTSGGSVDIGDRETVNAVVGGTVAWNQLVHSYKALSSTTSTSDGIVTITPTASSNRYVANASASVNAISVYTDHVYLQTVQIKSDGTHNVGFQNYLRLVCNKKTNSATWVDLAEIKKAEGTGDSTVQLYSTSNTEYQIKENSFVLYDLTAMFGSTIADYIYTLERGTAGAGVAYFRKLFPKPYYAYNAGELLSVNTSQHKMVGFNAYNPETGTAHVVGGMQYQITGAYTALSIDGETVTPDANGLFTPSADGVLTVTGGNSSTTCVHLVWDGERDDTYEPYTEWVYPLDSSLTLRGIPKLDASGNLYYDGDTYESDGAVTRKYGIVNLGTLTWTAQSLANNRVAYITNYTYWDDAPWLDRPNFIIPTPAVCVAFDHMVAQGASSWGSNVGVFTYSAALLPTKSFAIIKDSGTYADAAAFKAAMNNVKLVYELATPTTETATPYTQIQTVDDFGTEEYTDFAYENGDRDVAIPVGHNTVYSPNLRAKLEMSPNSPDGDGLYVVEQSNGQNEYVPLVIPTELPTAPSEDGTYTLKITVSGGTVTKSWIAEE